MNEIDSSNLVNPRRSWTRQRRKITSGVGAKISVPRFSSKRVIKNINDPKPTISK